MIDTRSGIVAYIARLREARDKIENRQDELIGPVPKPPFDEKTVRLEVEFITLGTVIRDLDKIINEQEFSYWDN